jgi:hypothetical protein
MALTPLVMTDVRIYYDSLDATGYSNKVEIAASVDNEEDTTFGSGGWKEFVGGEKDTQASATVFWQAGDLTMPDDVEWSLLGTAASNPLTIVPTSGAVGSTAYLTNVLEDSYKIGADVGKLLTADLGWHGNVALARGQILHPQGTARTSTGNGTAVQLTSPTSPSTPAAVLASQRIYCNLHVLSIAGTATPTITVALQSNVDNTFASPTTRATFTAATTLQGQSVSVAGPITDTWWRCTWTISGSTPSFLFAVSAGIASK